MRKKIDLSNIIKLKKLSNNFKLQFIYERTRRYCLSLPPCSSI